MWFTTLKSGILYAQKQNNFWFFGNEAGINFNSGSPVSITTGQMLSVEGCATVSDPVTGNLLFYTNGLQIWNANHTVMPNGNGILGGSSTSSTQGALIVPFPNNPGKYFVFTVDESIGGATNGFRYSVVNMNLNGGLGDVIPGQKNILLQNNVTERLAVAAKGDSTGYWVMIHERGNNIFKAYSIDQNGVNANPVSSAVGAIHTTTTQANGDETMGAMKFNHVFTKIAVAIYAGNKVQVFDFNNCSGTVSNPVTINTLDNPYGLEFSPDNSRLYYDLYYNAGFSGAVYQINMLAPNPASSVVLVGVSSSFNFQCMGAMQLAPDGKIYISINSESWLSSINNPNNPGVSCGFVDQAVILQQVGLFPSPGLLGLPQYVPIVNGTITPSLTTVSICQNQLPYLWNGNLYSSTGSYSVTLTNSVGCDSIAALNLTVNPTSASSASVTVCANDLPYLWNGQTINSTGTYTSTLPNSNGCDSVVTLTFTALFAQTSNINISICPTQLPYSWNNLTITSGGNYQATLTDMNGCDSVVTLNLTVLPTSSSTTAVSICQSAFPYSWNGQTYASPGSYSITLVNSQGCDSTATLTLGLLSPLSSTTQLTICSNQLPFNWNGQQITTTGNYSITLTGSNGCDSTAVLSLNIQNTSAQIIYETICSGQLPYNWNNQTLTGAGLYTANLTSVSGCDSIITFNLSVIPNNVSAQTINLCNSQFPFTWNSLIISTAGFYSDTLLNIGGCDSIITLTVSVINADTTAEFINLCNSQLPYLWNGISISIEGEYLYTTTGINGCDSVIVLTVSISDEFNSIVFSDQTVCIGETAAFSLSSNNGISSLLWDFGDPLLTNDSSTTNTPLYSYPYASEFNVTAIITTSCGIDTITNTISVIDCDTLKQDCQLFLPNAFTPNNDGKNERYQPVFLCIPDKYRFSIYNRWGENIFNTEDPDDGWDGTRNQQDAPSDVYIGHVTGEFEDGIKFEIKKVVSLIR